MDRSDEAPAVDGVAQMRRALSLAGAGVGLGIGSSLDIALNIFAGGEFNLASAGLPEGGVFLEVGPSLSLSPFAFGVIGRLGFNYHF